MFFPTVTTVSDFLAFSYVKSRVSPRYCAEVNDISCKEQTAAGLYTKFSGFSVPQEVCFYADLTKYFW